ncbi:MAG: hypothetical protein IJV94_00610 [Bacilli bacterium]|nr:hypothetical protein [Bacilli bacterium]
MNDRKIRAFMILGQSIGLLLSLLGFYLMFDTEDYIYIIFVFIGGGLLLFIPNYFGKKLDNSILDRLETIKRDKEQEIAYLLLKNKTEHLLPLDEYKFDYDLSLSHLKIGYAPRSGVYVVKKAVYVDFYKTYFSITLPKNRVLNKKYSDFNTIEETLSFIRQTLKEETNKE